MRTIARWITAGALALGATFACTQAIAQDQQQGVAKLTGFWLTTPHPELAIRPGETETIPLTLRNANLPPQRASLDVTGIPNGWEWSLKGGNREVSAVIVAPDSTQEINLELTPPEGASGESVPISVKARYSNQTAELPLVVKLSEAAEGGLELKSELPALRGTGSSTFSFKIEVTNDGAEENLFSLAANVPQGFQSRFKRGYGSEEITGLPIEAGASENLALEVTPPRSAPAGRYPVVVEVAGGGTSATTELSIEVTGQPDVTLTGPQERLSGQAEAGKEASFPFTLANNGSAPANDIELSASPPSGWKVEFEPERIDLLGPDATRQVNVRITPSEKAIAGDYMVSVRASGGPVSKSAQFRVTVNTSTIWGMAGLGVIATAVFVLGLAVMRYGRR
ncbi:NEW3 domain-containing protein [Sinorhizobium sp. 8-89]|uniref:NEW3 domain-containing protein n=1 Tax=Sinorhizobium sp. 7-81 TaxID=3049087 RepID=UPI0024C40218|nr:NEW3 domain-containing protein [Sinorhizobium sp. 7-81]MDK1384835.1 NEW3 domain-containing protein [Sinorhizobium sp. 7-81]